MPKTFPQKVIDVVRVIPSGHLVSYGQVARILGSPRAARVVGTALHSLAHDEEDVPWYRVVNKDGMISFRQDFFGQRCPMEDQAQRLKAEGLQSDRLGVYSLTRYGLSDDALLQRCQASYPDFKIDSSAIKEYLDLVDSSNRVIGLAPRNEVRQKNLLHRGVGILCWNQQGQLYVHQRTASKDLFPSLFDVMVGGAVEAGEPYLEAAIREVKEELGVTGTVRFLLEHLYEGPKNRAFVHLFDVCWDGPIRHQPEEILWGQWMDFKRVIAWINEVEIVPDGLEVFHAYLQQTQS